jgi:hypothetical protein
VTTTTDNGLIVRQGLDTTAYEPKNLNQAVQMSKILAQSGLLGKVEPKAEAVMFLMARGRELGFSTAQSIAAFNIIDGVPSLKAQAQVALCKKRRDVCEYLRWVGGDATMSTWETKRVGDPEATSFTYTIEDARLMGLLKPPAGGGEGSWQKQPATMLRWRSATAIIAIVYPDLVLGLHDPDEIREVAQSEGRGAPDMSITIIDHNAVDATVERAGEIFADEPELDDDDATDALADLAANPTPVLTPGVDRPWQEGDACPACTEKGGRGKFKTAKGGPRAGELQCTGKINGEWQNHPAPVAAVEPGERTYVAGSDCPFYIELGTTTKNGNPARYFLHEGELVCTGVDADGGAYAHRLPGQEPEPEPDAFIAALDRQHEGNGSPETTPAAGQGATAPAVGPSGESDVDVDSIPF